MEKDNIKLQLALDFTELERALFVAREAKDFVDIMEAGTPLIKAEGLNAVRTLRKEFPKHLIVADMKTMDTGGLEAEMALKAGADIVTVLSGADISTIEEAVKSARKYNGKVMVDCMNINNLEILKKFEEIGVDYLGVHVGIDQQMKGQSPIEFCKRMLGKTRIPIAIAGGINTETAPKAAEMGASIIIVGSSITKSPNPREAAKAIRESLKKKIVVLADFKREEKPESAFEKVTSSNLADAMHGENALIGIRRITGKGNVYGRIVTVKTYSGDWAKAVEAIDIANEGDIILIDAQGMEKAVWGGLASFSAKNKRISGVIVFGGVRDIAEIRETGFNVFASHVAPATGEPKGFGEINCELEIKGVRARPGDWAFGDDTGVVIIPRDKVLEIANRALDLHKREEELKKEIFDRKKTFSQVAKVEEWEKMAR